MPAFKFVQPDFTNQQPSAVKTNIEASIGVMARMAAAFAPHAQDTPDMTVRIDAGMIYTARTLTEVAAQNTSTITAPTTNPRIDRVVVDAATGTVSVITGTEDASPTAPAITSGKIPICQVLLDNSPSTTEITNADITDERSVIMAVASTRPVQVVCFGYDTDCETGDGKAFFRVPEELDGMDLKAVHAACGQTGTSGTMDIQIHNLTDTVDMLTTKITIDSGEIGSDTAATPAVIDTNNDDVSTNDIIRIDVDAVHTTVATGLVVSLQFNNP